MGGYHIASGVAFGIGWLLFIDGLVFANHFGGRKFVFRNWLPPLLTTLAFFVLNLVSPKDLKKSSGAFGASEERQKAQVMFFFSALIGMVGIGLALWWMLKDYQGKSGVVQWPGVSMLLSAITLLISAGIMFAGRSKGAGDDGMLMF